MQKIRPCLWFNGRAQEAVDFYLSVFDDGELLETSRYGEGAPMPAGEILTAVFRIQGQEFMILNGGPHYTLSPAVSFVVRCETQDEVDHYWNLLTEGGEEMPCAWLTDKFGVSWQIVPEALPRMLKDPDPQKAGRVMEAMMSMKKIDIAALEAARGGKG